LSWCPYHLGARTGIAYVDLREGRDEEARVELADVLEISPESVDALIGLGILAWRRGELEEVGRLFRRVEELDAGNSTAADYLDRLPAGLGPPPERSALVRPDTLEYHSRANGDFLEVRGPNEWEIFYVRGINLGAALPGRNPSEFPDSRVYAEWIRSIGEMGANTIRVYTIHPPHFYSALLEHNLLHPDRPLWLLHGVWTGLPPEDDYLDPGWEGDFFHEMRRVVDLLHGRADIPPRPGHASGSYTADVSPWILGYILGREWEPFSVLGFEALHPEFRSWKGDYLTVQGGNATDAWMGKAVEEIVRYEVEVYNHQRPVSYTNWPTLDPLHHPTETTVEEEVAIRTALGEVVDVRPKEYDNDAIGLDATLLKATEAFPAGVFATYHAYPYYPDFMAQSPDYSDASSSMGRSDYFGYLTALKGRHEGMPVVIAEYGVPASIGLAHMQPQGWHHGGHTEEEMAAIDRRFTLEIAESGMAGGAVFAWIDEWFKKNWIVLEFELPPERNRLWLNRLDAEQQYGMIAMEPPPPLTGASLDARLDGWRRLPALYEGADGMRLRGAADAAYLWLQVELPRNQEAEEIAIGFDLYDPTGGDFRWPGARGPELPVGLEFVLQVRENEARLVVDPSQNPFRFHAVGVGDPPSVTSEWPGVSEIPGFFRARAEQRFNVPYVTYPNRDGVYDSLRVIPNRRRISRDSTEILGRGYDRGILRAGEVPDGQWGWSSDGRVLEVRIPWMLLNFTDPSQRRVLQGPSQDPNQFPGADFSTVIVDGIRLVLGILGPDGDWRSWPESGNASEVALFSWPTWEEPSWEARRRPVFHVLRETFRELEGWDPGASGGGAYPWSVRQAFGVLDPEGANEAWNQGDTERAARLYRSILAADSSDARALHRVALMHAWSDEHPEALALFDRLLLLEPGNLEAEVDRARVLAWQGELDEAIGDLNRILDAHPDYPQALEAKAQFQSWAGEYGAALSSYDQLVGISQDPTGVLLAQARVLGWASRLEESRSVYDSILAVNPQNLEARLGLARLLAFSDETDEAVARYEVILQDHPGNPEARRGLARTLTWGGRLPDGEEAWRSSLEDFPRDLVSRIGLAQNLRWQGRNAAALHVLEEADPAQRENPDFLEQLERVRATLAPRVGISLIQEGDSDDNIMTTARMTGGWNPIPHLAVRGESYTRTLEQSALDLSRSSWGVNLQASYQLEPGWMFNAGAGGTRTDGSGTSSFTSLKAGITSPGRYPFGGAVNLSRNPLDATAQLVEQGVQVGSTEVSGRWTPAPGWQISGSAGLGSFSGEEENRRTHANVRVNRGLGGGWTVGLSHRYFGFDKDLNEFYFDPDYFGLSELTGRWVWEPGRLGFLLEGAPGVQKIRLDGDYRAALRASARLTFRWAPGREVFLSGGYSSAGLQSFSTEDSDYRYRALILGGSWLF
jgi:tetratricopeptide (TPR) repeat protein